MPIETWNKLLLILPLTALCFSVEARDFITNNCRLYCDQNFNFCLEKLDEGNKHPKTFHRMKNTCYVKRQECHKTCTNQAINLQENKKYQKLLKLKKQFAFKEWFPYKKVDVQEKRFNKKAIIKGVKSE